jgi:hypothetical protein
MADDPRPLSVDHHATCSDLSGEVSASRRRVATFGSQLRPHVECVDHVWSMFQFRCDGLSGLYGFAMKEVRSLCSSNLSASVFLLLPGQAPAVCNRRRISCWIPWNWGWPSSLVSQRPKISGKRSQSDPWPTVIPLTLRIKLGYLKIGGL